MTPSQCFTGSPSSVFGDALGFPSGPLQEGKRLASRVREKMGSLHVYIQGYLMDTSYVIGSALPILHKNTLNSLGPRHFLEGKRN